MNGAWLVVPTAGNRDLAPLIDGCGLPRGQIVIVTQKFDPRVTPDGTNGLTVLGGVNIHRWWNAGIEYAENAGARHIAVLNDDVRLTPDVLPAMAAELDRTGADLCCTEGDGMSGWAFMLPARGLRPDEAYQWWFGDTDLYRRAQLGRGVCRAGAVEHLHPGKQTGASLHLQELAEQDRVTFKVRWGDA